MAEPERCVAHPSRPAVDRCPTCDRPRCGADATGARCGVCSVDRSERTTRPPSPRELLVRAALAAHATALVVGPILAEYPGSPWFAYLAPLVGGLAVASAATAAAGEPRGPLLRTVRGVGILYALLATAMGFVLEGTYGLVQPTHHVLLPYVAAAGGAWWWSRPPKPRAGRAAARDAEGS